MELSILFLGCEALVIKDGKKSVTVSKAIFDQDSSLWGDCLLGQFFGTPPKLAIIQSLVNKLWGRDGKVAVIPLDGEGFLFKFKDLVTIN